MQHRHTKLLYPPVLAYLPEHNHRRTRDFPLYWHTCCTSEESNTATRIPPPHNSIAHTPIHTPARQHPKRTSNLPLLHIQKCGHNARRTILHTHKPHTPIMTPQQASRLPAPVWNGSAGLPVGAGRNPIPARNKMTGMCHSPSLKHIGKDLHLAGLRTPLTTRCLFSL